MEAAGGGFEPQVEVSGRGNAFYNLCFRHGAEYTSGVGYATDLTCALISGRYNYFENVYFYSPIYGQQDVAHTDIGTGYAGVHVTGHNNYFKGCKFGSALARDKANHNLRISGGVGNIFEDCIFQMTVDGTPPLFLFTDGSPRDMNLTQFLNCRFYAHSAYYGTAPADAFSYRAGGATAGVFFDSRCQFINVSNVSDTVKDDMVWKPQLRGEYGAQTEVLTLIAQRNQGA